MSVGNNVIDGDHKRLIEIINLAEKSLAAKNIQELESALENLSRYSMTHFAAEEKIARSVGYPHVAKLHDSHVALLERLDQFKQHLDKDWTSPRVDNFITLLREWLINHVIHEDLLMKPFLTQWSPEFDPR